MLKNSPESEVFISFYNLKPNAEYKFRVIAINAKGISPPSQASNYLKTLGKFILYIIYCRIMVKSALE